MLAIFLFSFALLFLFLKLNSAKIKGFVGETKVSAHLRFLGSGYITMSDVLLRNSKGSTSQIDHLVLFS